VAIEQIVLRDDTGREHRVTVDGDGQVSVGDERFTIRRGVDDSILVEGRDNVTAWVTSRGETTWVFADGQVVTFELERGRRKRARAHDGSLQAPMPATVRKVVVTAGTAVTRGDVLIVLEAMKMELPIRANADGTVTAINCREGEMVRPGQELVEISIP
jgi:biotin carboxyl carrier protein